MVNSMNAPLYDRAPIHLDMNCNEDIDPLPFSLDDPDMAAFAAWLWGLEEEDRMTFVNMLRDTDEMLMEGFEAVDIAVYLRRTYW